MKRFLYILAGAVFLVLTYLLLSSTFPKMADRIPLLVFLFAIDFYLWYSIRRDLNKLKAYLRYIITLLYWLPFVMMVGMGLALIVKPYHTWTGAFAIYAFGISFVIYISKLLAVLFFLSVDLVRIVDFTFRFAKAKRQKKPFNQEATTMNRARFLKTMGLAGGGLLLSGMLVGVIKWAYDFRVRRESIRLPSLPGSFDGLRIVQISDLHLGSWISSDPLDEAAEISNSLNPNLVLFTGDLVNSTTSEAIKFRDSLIKIIQHCQVLLFRLFIRPTYVITVILVAHNGIDALVSFDFFE
jgi:hypothetical protein